MSMYFVQHGIALDKSQNPNRPLSDEGAQYVKKMAKYLANLDLQINEIVHSGKQRAEQTAMLFASALNISMVKQHEYLNPNDDVTQITPFLEDNCMYIGHLPHMEKLVSKLLCGDDTANIVQFENAAVVCLHKEDNQYRLKWMLRPSMLH